VFTGNLVWNAVPDEERVAIISIAMSDDGTSLASIDERGTIRVWSLDKGTLVTSIDSDSERSEKRSLSFGPDNRTVAAAGKDGISIWNVESGLKQAVLVFDGSLYTAIVSRDGARIFGSGQRRGSKWQNSVVVWDMKYPTRSRPRYQIGRA